MLNIFALALLILNLLSLASDLKGLPSASLFSIGKSPLLRVQGPIG